MTLPASGAIAFSCINTELCRSSTAQLSMNCSSVRTLFGQASGAICMNTGHGKSNTTVPGAPTSVGGSASSSSAISVTFSAPASNGGLSIDLYQAISSPGCFTATAASSPISVTGLSSSTAYTFRVRAHNSKGYGCYSSASGSITTAIPPGSQSYTTPGTYTWTAPAGVTTVSLVAVGGGYNGQFNDRAVCGCCPLYFGGSGGGGGGLAYKNNFSVTPGTGYSVQVGISGVTWCGGACPGRDSYFNNTSTVRATGGSKSSGGTFSTGTGGGYGGQGGSGGVTKGYCFPTGAGGGGGAGGYCGGYSSTVGSGGKGYGRNPVTAATNGVAGSNGGGGGGGGGGSGQKSGAGGGVGIYGQGSNGTGGSAPSGGGGGGSSGTSGSSSGGAGGAYGGGGSGAPGGSGFPYTSDRCGNPGAVRIVWPGNTRTFPSTCVGA